MSSSGNRWRDVGPFTAGQRAAESTLTAAGSGSSTGTPPSRSRPRSRQSRGVPSTPLGRTISTGNTRSARPRPHSILNCQGTQPTRPGFVRQPAPGHADACQPVRLGSRQDGAPHLRWAAVGAPHPRGPDQRAGAPWRRDEPSARSLPLSELADNAELALARPPSAGKPSMLTAFSTAETETGPPVRASSRGVTNRT